MIQRTSSLRCLLEWGRRSRQSTHELDQPPAERCLSKLGPLEAEPPSLILAPRLNKRCMRSGVVSAMHRLTVALSVAMSAGQLRLCGIIRAAFPSAACRSSRCHIRVRYRQQAGQGRPVLSLTCCNHELPDTRRRGGGVHCKRRKASPMLELSCSCSAISRTGGKTQATSRHCMGSWDVRVEERQFTRCQAGVPHRQPRVAAPSSTCHRLALVAFHPRGLRTCWSLQRKATGGLAKSFSRRRSRRLAGCQSSADLFTIDASIPAGRRLSLQARQDSKPRLLTMARAAALVLALALGLGAVAAQNSPGEGLGRAGGEWRGPPNHLRVTAAVGARLAACPSLQCSNCFSGLEFGGIAPDQQAQSRGACTGQRRQHPTPHRVLARTALDHAMFCSCPSIAVCQTYVVKVGDTISTIASQFGTTPGERLPRQPSVCGPFPRCPPGRCV